MTPEDRATIAERLYTEIAGDRCVCRRLGVSNWCELCQARIGHLAAALEAERHAAGRVVLQFTIDALLAALARARGDLPRNARDEI